MKLVTWNLYRHNKNISKTISLALAQAPDILCFQEVNEKDLEYISSILIDYNLHQSNQVFHHHFANRSVFLRNVTAIRKQYALTKKIVFTSNSVKPKESILNKARFSKILIEHLLIEVEIDGIKYAVANLHLECLTTPSHRLRSCDDVHRLLDLSLPNIGIICGDFNSFAKPAIAPFIGPFSGYSRSDYRINERDELEKFFAKNGYVSPRFEGGTFNRIPFQLDYIFTNAHFGRESMSLLRCPNSDHKGIYIEI